MNQKTSLVISWVTVLSALFAACAPSVTPPAPQPETRATVTAPQPSPTAVPARPTAAPAQGQIPTPAARAASPTPAAPTPSPGTTSAAPQVKRGGVLQLALSPADLPHWDPHRLTGSADMWEYLGNYVINFDSKDGHPVPELAESWEFKDPKTLILHIRKGVRFHNLPPVNGRELVANDIVWNLERIRRPGALYIWKSNFEPVESFTAPDKYTVQIKLKYPFGPIVSYLRGTTFQSQVILAPEVEEKLGGEDAYKDLNNARGTGPFVIKSYTPGIGATAVRNPDYWQAGKPYMDEVRLLIAGDLATLVAAFRTGRADYAASSQAALDIVSKRNLERSSPSMKFTAVPDPYVVVLVPNVQKAPFSDIRIRKAMFLAIDRQEMLKVNLDNGGHFSGPMSPKLFPGLTWSEEEVLKREGFRPKNTPEGQQDIAAAQKLMREAGYGPDRPLIVEAEGTAQYAAFLNLTPTEIAKSELQKIWINISTIKMMDAAQWLQTEAAGNFLLRTRGYNAPMEPDAQLYTRHHTGASRNYQRLSDPELDKLLDDQRQELDVAKRKELVLKVQDRLWSLYPQVWLHTREAYFPQQPWVQMTPTPWKRWGDPTTTWISK